MFGRVFFALAACLSGLCLFLAAAPLAAQPRWVADPRAYLDGRVYVAAVGSGDSRLAAERDALRALASVFGLDVRAVEQIATLYREVAAGGATAWTRQTDYRGAIDVSVRMDNLIGAEARDRWHDGAGTHFVLAALHRGRAVALYSNRIAANLDVIRNLVDMPAADGNGLDAFARYTSAAAFADMNFAYGEILAFLGAPWRGTLARGEAYRLRAREAARATPIGVNVGGVDDAAAGRIRGAFAEVFSDGFGFPTGGINPRFALNVEVSMRPRERGGRPPLPGGAVYFSWIEVLTDVRACLVDASTGAVLLTYAFGFRGAGRLDPFDAERAAVDEAAQRIRDGYGDRLSRLVPRR